MNLKNSGDIKYNILFFQLKIYSYKFLFKLIKEIFKIHLDFISNQKNYILSFLKSFVSFNPLKANKE